VPPTDPIGWEEQVILIQEKGAVEDKRNYDKNYFVS
jgi:hypothetical protein